MVERFFALFIINFLLCEENKSTMEYERYCFRFSQRLAKMSHAETTLTHRALRKVLEIEIHVVNILISLTVWQCVFFTLFFLSNVFPRAKMGGNLQKQQCYCHMKTKKSIYTSNFRSSCVSVFEFINNNHYKCTIKQMFRIMLVSATSPLGLAALHAPGRALLRKILLDFCGKH